MFLYDHSLFLREGPFSVMQHLRIFNIEQDGAIVIVTPQGEGSAFRYQDLHLEANTVRGVLMKPEVKFLIIDLEQLEYFGSEFIGSLVSMLREMRVRAGKGCFCSARPQMLQVLQNMSLCRLWPHYDSREAAVAAANEFLGKSS
ncbi:MAG: STAS domain-containing protein [Planctomycetaceae bacterium]|nr:STAS domain-containing protein [Planctomycetaceae bacterium]